MYTEAWGRVSALLMFVGFNVTFFPQFILGYLGMPRRYHVYPAEFQLLNILSSAGATILAFGYVFPMVYLLWSLWFGSKATDNPWDAKGLEWMTTSPPPLHNFATPPVVDFEPYDYPEPGARDMSEARAAGVGVEGPRAIRDRGTSSAMPAILGMWAWLVTELLLFAGLFLIAVILRVQYPASVAGRGVPSQVLDRRHQHGRADRLVSLTNMVRLETISTAVLVAPIQNFRCDTAADDRRRILHAQDRRAMRNRPANSSSSVSSQAHMPSMPAARCCSSVVNCSSRSRPTPAARAQLIVSGTWFG